MGILSMDDNSRRLQGYLKDRIEGSLSGDQQSSSDQNQNSDSSWRSEQDNKVSKRYYYSRKSRAEQLQAGGMIADQEESKRNPRDLSHYLTTSSSSPEEAGADAPTSSPE